MHNTTSDCSQDEMSMTGKCFESSQDFEVSKGIRERGPLELLQRAASMRLQARVLKEKGQVLWKINGRVSFTVINFMY